MDHATHLVLKRNLNTGNFDDETEKLESAKPSPSGTYIIVYKSNLEKTYTFNESNLRYFEAVETYDPDKSAFISSKSGKALFNVVSCVKYQGTTGIKYRIVFETFATLYDGSKLKIFRKPRNSFSAYLHQMARIFDGSGDYLTKQFKFLPANLPETAYAPYADPTAIAPKTYPIEEPVIYPFGANLSQIEATEQALSHQISLIDGPPGTGKTQTILTIIANLLLRGKTVLVASPNNSATSNVAEKLEEKGHLGYLVATLGKKDNQKAFINAQPPYPDHVEPLPSFGDQAELDQMLLAYRSLLELQRKLAALQCEQRAWEAQRRHFGAEFPTMEEHASLPASHQIITVRDRISKLSRYGFSVGPLRAFKYSFVDHVGVPAWYRRIPNGEIELSLNSMAFAARSKELAKEIERIEEELARSNMQDLEARISKASLAALNAHLMKKYPFGKERTVFNHNGLFESRATFVEEYPVTTTTTNAARNQTGKDNYVYDYVIIDESSQASIVTGALALACAYNAVVVGDVRQLPTVISGKKKERIDSVFQQNTGIEEHYHCGEQSLLSSLLALSDNLPPDTIPCKTLKEHYRCNPYIIEFCNKKFYDNAMIVMPRKTRSRSDNDPKEALLALTTGEERHDRRNNYNRRQATTFCQDALFWIRSDPKDIGIATPYRRQVNNMKEDYTYALGETFIETVHKFQGRERDAIGFLTVANRDNAFISNPNLVNVAVSRAAEQLVVIASNQIAQSTGAIGELFAYIRYVGAEIRPSSVSSVFDLLYPNHTEELERFLESAGLADRRWKSEALVEALLRDICMRPEFNHVFGYATSYPLRMLFKDKSMFAQGEWRYICNNAHVDFAVFRSMSHEFLFGIEVNGSKHYNIFERKRHDALKRSIFKKAGLPLLTLPTNGDGERHELEKTLRSCMRDPGSLDTQHYVVIDDEDHPWFESINDEDFTM